MNGTGKDGQTLSATAFAELAGVSRERLRTWERRFGFPAPVRTAGGPRRYRVADVGRVVAVRRAAEQGVPVAEAVRAAAAARPQDGVSAATFRAAVEVAPVPVALLSGPSPVRVAWVNAALGATAGAPAAGAVLDDGDTAAAVRAQLAGDGPAQEIDGDRWGTARALVFRLPVIEPGTPPLVAVAGVQTRGEAQARRELAAARAELAELRRRGERHDRWLDAIAALAAAFQHDPGPDVIGAALDVLTRQTRAIDAGLATYAAGRLELAASRRGVLGASGLTVAGHPDVSRALRDAEGLWLDATSARMLGVPEGLHAAGLPITVAGDVLGLLVLLFDEVEPHDADNRRLLAAVSAGMGFALLRDRLVAELRAVVSAGAEPRRRRFVRRGAGAPPTGG